MMFFFLKTVDMNLTRTGGVLITNMGQFKID